MKKKMEGSRKYKGKRSKFLLSEFGIHFGTDATKLENWKALCLELAIQNPIKASLNDGSEIWNSDFLHSFQKLNFGRPSQKCM
jgi:hypothetical protein